MPTRCVVPGCVLEPSQQCYYAGPKFSVAPAWLRPLGAAAAAAAAPSITCQQLSSWLYHRATNHIDNRCAWPCAPLRVHWWGPTVVAGLRGQFFAASPARPSFARLCLWLFLSRTLQACPREADTPTALCVSVLLRMQLCVCTAGDTLRVLFRQTPSMGRLQRWCDLSSAMFLSCTEQHRICSDNSDFTWVLIRPLRQYYFGVARP